MVRNAFAMAVFEDVLYFVSSSLSLQCQSDISNLLLNNGAVGAPLDQATHVITSTNRFDGWQTVSGNTAVVTENWVERSIILGKIQPTQYYSADPLMLFSGVVACAAELPTSDLEVLSAGIMALGGQFRMGLTREITHLFALSPSNPKYQTAMHYRAHTNVKILLPHWFDDTIRFGYGGLETALYEWPNPRVLESGLSIDAMEREKHSIKEKERKALLKSLQWTPDSKEARGISDSNVWNGKRIVLGKSLQFSSGRREAMEAIVARGGGVVFSGDVEDADILVTRHRHGKEYLRALKLNKTIGTLSWLFHVQSTGIFSAPTDHLLHYPVPKRPIESFSSHIISVTNYTGESRDYLKTLIGMMGAVFTPSMSGENTVLVAAYISGAKATKARSWSIPIVNHTWLEDCFIQWKSLTVALEKYVVFPPGMDFSTVLGVKGVTGVELDLEVEELAQGDDEDVENGEAQKESTNKDARELGPDSGNASELERFEKPHPPRSPITKEISKDTDNMENAELEEAPRHRSPDMEEQPNGFTTPKRAPFHGEPAATSPRVVASVSRSQKPRKHGESDVEDDDSAVEEHLLASKPSVKPKSNRVEKAPATESKTKSTRAENRARKLNGKTRHEAMSLDSGSDNLTPDKRRDSPLVFSDSGTETDFPDRVAPIGVGRRDKEQEAETSRTPKRVMSVLVPPSPYHISPSRSVADDDHREGDRTRTVGRRVGTSTDAPQPRVTRTYGKRAAENRFGVTRSPSKRAAASRATQNLKEKVMPDVVNYQMEMKRNKERKRDKQARTKVQDESEDAASEEDIPAVKKRKVGWDLKSSKKVDQVGQGSRPRLKEKTPATSDEDNAPEVAASSLKRTDDKRSTHASAPRRTASVAVKNIRLMTTGCTLSDPVIKSLAGLGIKITNKPSDSTHLVVPRLLRTEKFLCALAVAPHILTEKWASDSAALHEIQPEEKYLLVDEAGEAKHNFKLSETLEHAKRNQGRLFSQKLFFVTPKVPVDQLLLRNVVTAYGGQFSSQRVTDRLLKNGQGRFLISCQEDEPIWRPLAEEHPIYTHELILTSVLRQTIDWDDPAFRVPGSL